MQAQRGVTELSCVGRSGTSWNTVKVVVVVVVGGRRRLAYYLYVTDGRKDEWREGGSVGKGEESRV